MACFQRFASKANVTLELPLVTGGSWKKSPVTMSCQDSISVEVSKRGKSTPECHRMAGRSSSVYYRCATACRTGLHQAWTLHSSQEGCV
ncbi:hypothetical protein B0H12DRAFT_1019221 [Mycena haematopus]|nr:hypothetical protein B0H12DRAFT_1019221 [Mycena haematopus]